MARWFPQSTSLGQPFGLPVFSGERSGGGLPVWSLMSGTAFALETLSEMFGLEANSEGQLVRVLW